MTLPAWDELLEVARNLRVAMPAEPLPACAAQARPGDALPAFVAAGDGLAFAHMTWGYAVPWTKRLVYNARIENAGGAMWAPSFSSRRAVVPVAAFFEPQKAASSAGRRARGAVEFRHPKGGALLLGAVHEGGRLSIVTTEPNAQVAPVHHRMPLVLAPAEVALWFGPGWRALADRTCIALSAAPERREAATADQLALF